MADALASGASVLRDVGVQVPLRPPERGRAGVQLRPYLVFHTPTTLSIPAGVAVVPAAPIRPAGRRLTDRIGLSVISHTFAGCVCHRRQVVARWGTGSTPVYFDPWAGADYTAIVDNAAGAAHLLVFVSGTGQLVCSQPVLTHGGPGSENAAIGAQPAAGHDRGGSVADRAADHPGSPGAARHPERDRAYRSTHSAAVISRICRDQGVIFAALPAATEALDRLFGLIAGRSETIVDQCPGSNNRVHMRRLTVIAGRLSGTRRR